MSVRVALTTIVLTLALPLDGLAQDASDIRYRWGGTPYVQIERGPSVSWTFPHRVPPDLAELGTQRCTVQLGTPKPDRLTVQGVHGCPEPLHDPVRRMVWDQPAPFVKAINEQKIEELVVALVPQIRVEGRIRPLLMVEGTTRLMKAKPGRVPYTWRTPQEPVRCAVSFRVDLDGRVQDVQVTAPAAREGAIACERRHMRRARAAVSRWRFLPTIQDGEPQAVTKSATLAYAWRPRSAIEQVGDFLKLMDAIAPPL